MARNLNGTSHYIEAGSAVVSAEPLTMACWFRSANVTATKVIMSLSKSGGTERFMLVEAQGVAQPLRADSVNSGGTIASAISSGAVTAGKWHHATGIWATSSSRSVYLDGTNSGTNATAITVSGVNRTIIGARISSGSYGAFFAGDIARVGVWNVALTADEIASLAKGFCPCMIRPQSLAFFAPLLGAAADLRGGLTLTDTGTTAADHPRIILPS